MSNDNETVDCQTTEYLMNSIARLYAQSGDGNKIKFIIDTYDGPECVVRTGYFNDAGFGSLAFHKLDHVRGKSVNACLETLFVEVSVRLNGAIVTNLKHQLDRLEKDDRRARESIRVFEDALAKNALKRKETETELSLRNI